MKSQACQDTSYPDNGQNTTKGNHRVQRLQPLLSLLLCKFEIGSAEGVGGFETKWNPPKQLRAKIGTRVQIPDFSTKDLTTF